MIIAYFGRYPEKATLYGIDQYGHSQLADRTLNSLANWQVNEDWWLLKLSKINQESLIGTPEYITYGVLKEYLEANIDARVCRHELWNVSHLSGWQSELSEIAERQPVGNRKNRLEALQRWRQLPTYIDQEINNLREGITQGYTVSSTILPRVIEQLEGILALAPEDSPFFIPGDRDNDANFREESKKLVVEFINPAILKYKNFLESEYFEKARDTIGISHLPNGETCYQAMVRLETTLNMPAKTIYKLGENELSKLKKELAIISKRSFNNLSNSELFKHVNEPIYRFNNEQEILDYNIAALNRAKRLLPQWFNLLPKADIQVKPYPGYRAMTGAPGEYIAPSQDGIRPGTFLTNTHNPTMSSRVDSEATLYHEAMPGHHLQVALAQEQKHLHPSTFFLGESNSGYIEGWALYAERLADEMNLYSNDLDRVGLISNASLRAARLVVDPGLHVLGWSKQDAVDYLIANTAISQELAMAEVERYISMPAQATGYTLGMLEITKLRNLSEQKLKQKFDIRQFHDEILKDGVVTLGLLREKIENWINS